VVLVWCPAAKKAVFSRVREKGIQLVGQADQDNLNNLRSFLLVSASTFLIYSGYYFLMPVLPVYLAAQGYSEPAIGVAIGITSVAVIFLKFYSGALADRKSKRLLMRTGALLAALAIIVYGGSREFFVLLLARLLHGTGLGYFHGASVPYVVEIVQEPDQSKVNHSAQKGNSVDLRGSASPEKRIDLRTDG
jgi:predicted MFS family arabinose efflux permease